jgi:alpha-amylase
MYRSPSHPVSLVLLLALLAACGPGAQQAAPTAASIAATVPTTAAAPDVTATAVPTTVPTTADVPDTTATALPTAAPAPVATPATEATAFPLAAGWWDDAVCYQVFVRSFYDDNGDGVGDLSGLIKKLDYINDGDPQAGQDLGATCVWLMPIAASNTYHGYAVTDYYTVNPEYGTADDFKHLVEEAHRRGIRILVDLVLNHTSSEHSWFKEAASDPSSPHRDWYLWSQSDPGTGGWHKSPVRDEYYYSAFDGGLPDLNYRNPAVTEEAYTISRFWLKDMGADGFRLDAVKHLIENGSATENTPETNQWLRDYQAFLERETPGSFTIGENYGASAIALESYYPDQLVSYFEFNVGANIIAAVNLGDANKYIGAVRAAYEDLPSQRWAPFLANHDQNRAMSQLGNRPDRARLAAIALLTLPGMPFVYYGEEIGMLGVRGDDGPLADEPRRSPMQWSADPGAGFTAGTPWSSLQTNYAEANVAAEDGDPSSLLNLYRRLTHLHTTSPALGHGSFAAFKGSNSVAAFVRQAGDEAILVLLNFGRQPAEGLALTLERSDLPPGTYQLASLLDGGATAAPLTVGASGAVAGYAPLPTIPARAGYVFSLRAK